MIQPHLPIRLPCYDFTPVTAPAFDRFDPGFGRERLPWCDGRCVQGPGTYSPQYADLRLLAIPTSCRRVAACNPNWGMLSGVRSGSLLRFPLSIPLEYVCSPGHKGHDDLTSSPPSSAFSAAVPRESPALPAGNTGQGLRSLRDLTQHLTARADDSHAPPVFSPPKRGTCFQAFRSMSSPGKVLRVASN